MERPRVELLLDRPRDVPLERVEDDLEPALFRVDDVLRLEARPPRAPAVLTLIRPPVFVPDRELRLVVEPRPPAVLRPREVPDVLRLRDVPDVLRPRDVLPDVLRLRDVPDVLRPRDVPDVLRLRD
ncbi:MAG: hypothetical protein JF623_07570, partial [Acidobacteria bacterium]|nr:hypothetical protein [Acidobacteriota bacterium]